MAAVFAAHYGLGTVMFQVESLVFLPRQLPPGFLPRLFAMGALVALLFAPVRSSNFVFGCLVGVAFARRR